MGITSSDRLRCAGIGPSNGPNDGPGKPRVHARRLAWARGFGRALLIAAAGALAACAQPAVFADKSEPEVATPAPVLAADPEPSKPAPARKPKATSAAKDRAAAGKPTAEKKKQTTYYGLASYYSHQNSRTANGERFNPRDMTAAHRTLPFGTRVRVTELKTGRSVTLRINDRGPFIEGRIVDVSKSAAEELGMIGRGITRVKLEVVEDEDTGKVRPLAKRDEPSYAAAH